MNNATMAEIFGEAWNEVKAQAQGLKVCTLKDFVKNVIIHKFGIGNDGAINGLKSWFTVREATDAAISCGYDCTVEQAQNFLDDLVGRRYFERKGDLYRRCAIVGSMNL